MRVLYAAVGVLGGLLGLAATYFFFVFAMFMGGGKGNVGAVILYVILVFLLASLINLVAGFLNPRKPLTSRLLLTSAALWLLAGAFFGIFRYTDPEYSKDLLLSMTTAAVLVAPALLPLAAWALVRWKFTGTQRPSAAQGALPDT
jgi:hypothetical protein